MSWKVGSHDTVIAFGEITKTVADGIAVPQQVLVAHHHALGRRRRSRGVLQVGEIGGCRRDGPPPLAGGGLDIVRADDRRARRLPVAPEPLGQVARVIGRRQHHRRAAVGDHSLNPADVTPIARGVERDGKSTGVEAADERGHVVEAGRMTEQRRLSSAPPILERRSNRARPRVQLREAQRIGGLTINEKRKRRARTMHRHPPLQDVDQGRQRLWKLETMRRHRIGSPFRTDSGC